ncbi:hypothetical protein DOT_2182 [Desulfosporosinus sp. OT]|nr:hypothetical protein DOT_2182 [Desulfosporosinus sp. OT]
MYLDLRTVNVEKTVHNVDKFVDNIKINRFLTWINLIRQ